MEPNDIIELEDALESILKRGVLRLCSSTKFVNEISETILKIISEKFEKEIERLENTIKDLKDKCKKQDQLIGKLVHNIDTYDKKSIRIYNCPQTDEENCTQITLKLINQELKVPIGESEIEYCFRVKEGESATIHPILVKFTTVDTKQNIYKQRALLKEYGMIMREHLPEDTMKIIRVVIEKLHGKKIVMWTDEGVVYISKGDYTQQVNSLEEAEYLDTSSDFHSK